MKLATIFIIVLTISGLLFSQTNLSADEIRLKNGDKISGQIINDGEVAIIIETEAMGQISVKREFIKEVIADKELGVAVAKQETPDLWKREISIGYNEARGNTENSQLSLNIYANRKTDDDEFTIKANNFYSSSNKKMDSQNWYSLVRYAFSFGGRKWYNFYKLEANHNKFSNIDYRLVPAVGLGYWYSDTPTWKAMVETAIGLEHTKFKQGVKDSDEVVLVPRAFFEAALFEKSKISQDISLYSSLSNKGECRLRSETMFENPISEELSVRFSLINDYNSDPPEDTKKSDLRLISSLVYSF
ncbi:MAG: DUF481 domain-containing protein [Nitrospirota bacterium]